MPELSEKDLELQIDQLYQQFNSRLTGLLVSPGETGHSAQVVTAMVALLVEFHSRFTAFVPLARRFDTAGNLGAASQRLSAINAEFELQLKEASFHAAFKVVYEKFEAYVHAMPRVFPPEASQMDLAMCRAELVTFQQTFHTFEPRAAQLAAEGILPSMQEKWLTPMAKITQQHIEAIDKRREEQKRKMAQQPIPAFIPAMFTPNAFAPANTAAPAAPAPANNNQWKSDQLTTAFNNAYYEMNAAVKPLSAQRELNLQNPWADPTPNYTATLAHYQTYLNRIAELEPGAKELAAAGLPKLLESMNKEKTDILNASAIIQQMIGSQQSYQSSLLAKQGTMLSNDQAHRETMFGIQQGITNIINKHK